MAINLRNYKTLLVLCNWSSACYPLGALSIAYTSTGYFIKKGEVGGWGANKRILFNVMFIGIKSTEFLFKERKTSNSHLTR